MPTPTHDHWLQIANEFERKAFFPHCIGAIDGKLIRIVKPYNSGSQFINYKHFFSTVLLAVADANYQFIYVHVGSFGKDSDSAIFQNTSLWQKLTNQTLNLPHPTLLPQTSFSMPYMLVGDEAFSLSNYVLRPYAGSLSLKKRIFNYRLTLARRYVECTFGILSNKWRIFHRPIDTSVEFADHIVKACCVLHNFVRKRDGFQFEQSLEINGLEDVRDLNNTSVFVPNRASFHIVRDKLADYFMSQQGSIPWQYSVFN